MIIDYFLFDFRKALLSSDFTIISLVVWFSFWVYVKIFYHIVCFVV